MKVKFIDGGIRNGESVFLRIDGKLLSNFVSKFADEFKDSSRRKPAIRAKDMANEMYAAFKLYRDIGHAHQ